MCACVLVRACIGRQCEFIKPIQHEIIASSIPDRQQVQAVAETIEVTLPVCGVWEGCKQIKSTSKQASESANERQRICHCVTLSGWTPNSLVQFD